MVKLHFNSPEEFETLFRSKDIRVTRAIVQSIEDAMREGARSANMFEVSFEDSEIAYNISLPQKQWVQALQTSLDFYHENNLIDEQIDTWKLLEAARDW